MVQRHPEQFPRDWRELKAEPLYHAAVLRYTGKSPSSIIGYLQLRARKTIFRGSQEIRLQRTARFSAVCIG